MGPFTRIDCFKDSNSARGSGPQILSYSGLNFIVIALLHLLDPEDQDLALLVVVLKPSEHPEKGRIFLQEKDVGAHPLDEVFR